MVRIEIVHFKIHKKILNNPQNYILLQNYLPCQIFNVIVHLYIGIVQLRWHFAIINYFFWYGCIAFPCISTRFTSPAWSTFHMKIITQLGFNKMFLNQAISTKLPIKTKKGIFAIRVILLSVTDCSDEGCPSFLFWKGHFHLLFYFFIYVTFSICLFLTPLSTFNTFKFSILKNLFCLLLPNFQIKLPKILKFWQ